MTVRCTVAILTLRLAALIVVLSAVALHATEPSLDKSRGTRSPCFKPPHNVGLPPELDRLAFNPCHHRRTPWLNRITVNRDLTNKFSGYLERVASITQKHGSPWARPFDFGLDHAVAKNVQPDTGRAVDHTRSPPDLRPFLGLPFRY